MATTYNKKQWATGNLIGAVDLNRMETGIEEASTSGGGSLVIRITSGSEGFYIYDKTWQEVSDAYDAGLPVYLQEQDTYRYHLYRREEGAITFGSVYSEKTLRADSPDGYLYYQLMAT